MKLRRKQVMQYLRPILTEKGYVEFKCDGGFFCKKIDDFFYLCMSPNIHRFYDDQFTVDLYLSNVIAMYLLYGDIPWDCSIRPGFLLSEEEKMHRYNSVISDVWWSFFDEEERKDFLEVLLIAESRIPERCPLLREKLEKSEDIKDVRSRIDRIIDIATNETFDHDATYMFIPERKGQTPEKWFYATEYFLTQQNSDAKYLKYAVPDFANQAFCHFVMENLNSPVH